VSSIRAEGEVEQRMNHDGSVDCPLHDGDVGLAERQELRYRKNCSNFKIGHNILHIKQLEWGARGFKDQNEEQSDQRQPEVGWPETAGAASSGLDEESEPRDDQEDDGENEGEEEGGKVEVETGSGSPVNAGVHAHGGVLGSAGNNVLVRVISPGSDLSEERGGDREQGGEEPDQRDVDGVRPRSGNILALSPLGVLHKQMIGQEEDCQRQEEQEAVVEIPKTDAKLCSQIPCEMNDFRVQSCRNAQASQ